MTAELRLLLADVPAAAPKTAYWAAAVERNVLGKKTAATRRLSVQRLSELYALDPATPVFQLLRKFWDHDEPGRPLLALLCAAARDPLLRVTAPPVLQARVGDDIATTTLEQTVADAFLGRFNPSTQNKIARNAASSWTQSGHLHGRTHKRRSRPVVTSAAAAYALALGYFCGSRGQLLLQSFWVSLLGVTRDEVIHACHDANRCGWVIFRSFGNTVEIRFPEGLLPVVKE